MIKGWRFCVAPSFCVYVPLLIRADAGAGYSLVFCPLVLNRPVDLHTEFFRCVKREVGIAEEFASHEDHVGLPVVQNLFRLCCPCDQAYRPTEDSSLSNFARELHLVAGRDRDCDVRDDATTGAIDQIDDAASDFNRFASSIDSSTDHPPFFQSVADIRRNGGYCSGHSRRMASTPRAQPRCDFRSSRQTHLYVGSSVGTGIGESGIRERHAVQSL